MTDLGFLPWLIGAIVLGGAITAGLSSAGNCALALGFAGLGDMRGKTKTQIILAVGPPTSISAMGQDQTLLQWQATGYHIAILFQGELFLGVTHEYAANS